MFFPLTIIRLSLIEIDQSSNATLAFNDTELVLQSTFYEQAGTTGNPTLSRDSESGREKSLTIADKAVQEIIATTSKVANGNAMTLSETLLGTVAFVQQGAEFIAEDGLAAMGCVATANALMAFGAMHGGSNKYLTGLKTVHKNMLKSI